MNIKWIIVFAFLLLLLIVVFISFEQNFLNEEVWGVIDKNSSLV